MTTTTELAMTTVNVLKSAMDWAISSQASWGQDEGSTTRLSNLEQKKSPRVRKFCVSKIRYSLSLHESARS